MHQLGAPLVTGAVDSARGKDPTLVVITPSLTKEKVLNDNVTMTILFKDRAFVKVFPLFKRLSMFLLP